MAKERNYSEDQIVHLLAFIELMLILPKDLEEKIQLVIHDLYKNRMGMEPTAHQQGVIDRLYKIVHGYSIEQGFEKRVEMEKLDSAKEFLERKVSPDIIAQALKLPIKKVLDLKAKL